MEKNCKSCYFHCRIRGNDFAKKLGCMKHSKKVDATELCDDFRLLTKNNTLSIISFKEEKVELPRNLTYEKKVGEKSL